MCVQNPSKRHGELNRFEDYETIFFKTYIVALKNNILCTINVEYQNIPAYYKIF